MEKRTINIAIIEDSSFYGTLLCNYISKHLAKVLGSSIQINLRYFPTFNSFFSSPTTEFHVSVVDYCLEDDKTSKPIIHLLKSRNSATKVMVLTQNNHRNAWAQSISAGANEFVRKNDKYAMVKAALFVEQSVIDLY